MLNYTSSANRLPILTTRFVVFLTLWISSWCLNFARSQTFTTGQIEAGTGCDWPYNATAYNPVDAKIYGFWRKGAGATATYKLIRLDATGWTTVGSFGVANVGFSSASDDVGLAIDGTGKFHVVFRGERGSGFNSTRGVWYGSSTNGTSWAFTEIQTFSDPNGWKNTDDPVIELDASNRPHIVFLYSDVNNPRLYTLRYYQFNGSSWSGQDAFSQSGGTSFSNEINDFDFALDGNGKAHIAFQREMDNSGLDGGLWYVNNTSGAWTATELAHGIQGQQQGLSIAMDIDAANKVHIIHADYLSRLLYVTNTSGVFASSQINGSLTGSVQSHNFQFNSNGDRFLVFSGKRYAYLRSGTSGNWTTGSYYTSAAGSSGTFYSGTLAPDGKIGILFDNLPSGDCSSANTRNLWHATATLPPLATVSSITAPGGPTNAASISFTVTFSQSVSGVAASNFSLTTTGVSGASIGTVSGSGTTRTVTVNTGSGSGTIRLNMANATGVTPAVTNVPFTTGTTVTIDKTAPAVSSVSVPANGSYRAGQNLDFIVNYSETVVVAGTPLLPLTIGATGVQASYIGGSGTSALTFRYTIQTGQQDNDGIVLGSALTLNGGTIRDAASNNAGLTLNNVASTVGVLVDAVAPTVTINRAAAQADPTNASPINFTVVFSEGVSGFTASDITLSGTAGATTAVISGSGPTYTVAVSGMTTSGTVVASIAAGVATDAAGNSNAASSSTDNSVAYDAVRPTVTINQATSQVDPTRTSPVNFTVVFSEAVSNFATGDVTLSGTAGATTATVSGSGTTYNVAVSGMTTSGTVTASIGAGVASDAAGNTNTASTSTDNLVTYDATAPTVTINQASSQADPARTSPINFTVVFSEAVTGFATGDVSLAGSTAPGATATVSGSGTTYTVAVSGMTGSGTIVASIVAGVATDAAGNGNAASTSSDNSVTYDVTAPTVTINQAAGQNDPTNTSPINFTVVFSEAVSGFTSSDIILSGTAGATTAFVTGNGTTFNVAVSGMTTSGTVIATINAGAATDAAGNNSAASTSTDNTVTYDAVAPTVTIDQAPGQLDPANTSPINFRVVFSQAVTGFATGDVTLGGTAGATTATVTGSGTTYTVAVSGMTTSGTVIASIAAGVAIDAAGNSNAASSSTDNSVAYDAVRPTVTINQTSTQADPARTSPVNFTVVFSEPVSGFATGDVSLAGSTAPGATATVSGSGTTYTVAVSGMTGNGTIVASIVAGVASDAAGNTNTASTSTDNTVTYDATAPTVTINQATSQADPTRTSPVNFTVVFSEAVSNFATGDVSLAGSTAPGATATVSGSGTTYNVAVSGMTASGTIVASIVAGVATDAAGNGNVASTSTDNTVTYDVTPPTVTINQAAGQNDPTNVSPINFTVVFSETVSGFTNTDISLSGSAGATTATVTGSGTTYNVAVSGMTASGTVTASIGAGVASDAAGNTNTASTSGDNSVAYDITAPTVTINQATGQNDPTRTSPISFTVVFSEPVSGFTASDITLSGTAGPTTAVISGSGPAYTVAVSGMTASGTVIASIAAGAATDAAGNSSVASTSTDNTVTYDAIAPTVTINQTVGQFDPTNASPISFTVVFSEPVTGFNASDISFSGSTALGTLVAAVSGTGANYTVTVSGMTGGGTVVVSIPAGSASDFAGNPSAGSTSTDNTVTYDATPPTVTVNQALGQNDPTNTSPINFTVVFSEAVSGFTSSDITLSGTAGATTAVISGSGPTYNVAVSGMTTSGTVIASVNASAATDAAGNNSVASTSSDNTVTYDATAPTVTIDQAPGQLDPTNTSPINFRVVFSQAVTGFATGGVTLGGTAGATTATVSGSGTTYNVAVSGMTTSGTVVASIAAGVAVDVAGNTNTASTSTDNTVTYDATAPTVTINQATSQVDPTRTSPVNFTVVFSEPVSGFVAGDVSLTGSTAPGATATVSGSGTTYTVAVSGMTGSGTIVASIAAGVAADAAGNGNAASTSTDNSVTYDATPPTVTINQTVGQNDPTNTSPVNFMVVFSETVSGFTNADISLSGSAGATTATVTEIAPMNGTTFNVAVSGMTGSGTVIASIAANVAADLAGNPNTASTSTDNTVIYDVTPPTVTVNQASGQNDPANASPINFTVVFSEPVNGFTSSAITIGGTAGATTAVISGSGPTYNVAVSGMAGGGTVTVSIGANAVTDAAGNGNTASTSSDNSVTYDVTPPTVTINQAAGQADPTTGSPVNFTVVFSEPVANFATGDVTLTGSAGATTATVSGSGTTYNVAVSGMTASGTVTASIGAGVASDAAGNANLASTSINNTVTYNIACLITCPTVPAQSNDAGQCGAIVNYPPASTTGNCGTLMYSHLSGSIFPIGTTTVTVTSTASGQQCTFTVTVNDTELPQITTCPGNQTVGTAPNQCQSAPVSFAAIATDNCPAGLTVQYFIGATEISSPYAFAKGTTTVTVRAKDAAGNETSCSFDVTVNDTQNPTVTAPANVTVYTGAGATTCNKLVTVAGFGVATHSDNCSGETVQISGVPAGNIFPVGTTVLTYTVTDGAGLTATATQNIIVVDNTPPVFACPGNVTVYTGPGRATCDQTASWTVPSPTDNCNIQSLTATHNPGATFPVGNTTVQYTALDVNGNQSQCSFTVTVIDNTPPVISGCPSNITVNTGAGNPSCTQTATWTAPTATDNCGGSIAPYAVSHMPGSTFNSGTTTVTYKFRDADNNESVCSFTVTVVDNTPPVISGCPADQTITASGSATATWTEPTAADNCNGSVAHYYRSHAPGSSFGAGTTAVTYKFKDAAGNESICSFNITVSGTLVTSIPDASAYTTGVIPNTVYIGWSPASAITYTASAAGQAPYTYLWTASAGLSIVGAANGASVQVTSAAPGVYTLTLTVTDFYGTQSTATKQVTAVDVRCGNKLDKVTICQIPPDNPANARTNCLSENAAASQLSNGSTLGSCPVEPATTRTNLLPAEKKLMVSLLPVEKKLTVSRLAIDALPNPSFNDFILSVKAPNANEAVLMKVIDAGGRVKEIRKLTSPQTVRVGAAYRPGLYLVEVSQGKERQTLKLMKLSE